MKILLTTLNTKYVHTNIALKYLYETIKEKDVSLKEYSINEPLGKILRDINSFNADVLAFSVYIWNVEETLKICENIRKIRPEIKMILGGPEVTYRSEEILKQYKFISFEEITKLKYVEEMVDVFYNSLRYKNSLNLVLGKFETPFGFYYELSTFALENGLFERKISAEEWMDVLYKFYRSNNFEDITNFVQELRKDHFNSFRNKRRRGLAMFELGIVGLGDVH